MFSSLTPKFGGYPVTRRWIPKSRPLPAGPTTSRPGKLLAKVGKVVIGDTGWPGLKAIDAAKDLGQAYGHFLIDGENIIECIPALTSSVGLVEQARFVETTPGQEFNAQESAIAVNLCFGGQIVARDTFDRCVALVAFVCDRFELDPAGDVKRAGDLDPARKDPDQALQPAGADFKRLVQAISEVLEKAKAAQPRAGPPLAPAKPESAHA